MNDSHYRVSDTICEICGGTVTYSRFMTLQDKTSIVCDSTYCTQISSEMAKLPPGVYKFRVEQHREQIHKRKAKEREQREYKEKVEQKEILENQSILDWVAKNHQGFSANPPALVTIPSGKSETRDLGESRREAYQSHLKEIIYKAFEDSIPDGTLDEVKTSSEKLMAVSRKFNDNPDFLTITEHLCGRCKGGCCADGGNTAYLEVSTMVRVRQRLPDHSAEELLNEYTSRLDHTTVAESCINQTPTGCSLPRELRAGTCNVYFCDGIHELEDEIEGQEELPPVLAVRRSNTNWNRFDPSFENEVVEVTFVEKDDSQDAGLKHENMNYNHLLNTD